MTWLKKSIKWFVWGSALLMLFVGISNVIVIGSAKSKIKEKVDELRDAKIGLVLGTSKSTRSGTDNLFFTDRMKAAAELYFSGKVKHLIVSGDNRTIYYNEPQDMLEALEKLGVPSKAITLDYGGLRTLDSVVRCREIFGQADIIIVTQKFHAYRAIFIAHKYSIAAQAYSANFDSKTVFRLLVREMLARPLAILDIYILNRSPRYLVEKEILEVSK